MNYPDVMCVGMIVSMLKMNALLVWFIFDVGKCEGLDFTKLQHIGQG